MHSPGGRFNLEGRVAVVTGGTRGLGAGFAEALTDAGASVMLAGRDAERGRAVSQALAEREATAAFTTADVTVPHNVVHILDATLERFGRVDILINNAGVREPGPAGLAGGAGGGR